MDVTSMTFESIGKRIRKCREEKNWRQEDLAERAELSVIYIGMIERGEKLPRLQTFVKLANILEVSADQLLADVLITGSEINTSIYTEKISKLPQAEQDRIYDTLDTLLRHA